MEHRMYTVPFWDTLLDALGILNVKTFEFYGLTINLVGIVAILGVLALTYLAIRGPGVITKVVSLIGGIFIIGCLLVAFNAQLSHPKWLTPAGQRSLGDKSKVMFTRIRAGISIDIVEKVNEATRTFKLPWTKEAEENLLKEREKEAGTGGNNGGQPGGQMYFHYRYSDDGRPVPEFFFIPHSQEHHKQDTPPPQPFEFKPAG